MSIEKPELTVETLRTAIQEEYEAVALHPERGFHFFTGYHQARIVGYPDEWLVGIPESTIESFAGTGNPFGLGTLSPGENVVDIGCGSGMDSFIAARMVAPSGQVIGIDMTPAMLDKARHSVEQTGMTNITFREGYAEALPVEDGWADVVISNGVLNLVPDKVATLQEMARILKPAGRLQIADILVQKAVPNSAKRKIDLWTG
jgi:SAM-dependent methyltransferase